MTGFVPLLAKEFLEIRRTWRIWVVPGILLVFAVSGPIIALITPRLLSSIATQQPGVVIRLPVPTAMDAYAQFLKGLSQIVLIALIIGGAGSVSGERASGTAIMVLSKPVSRASFLLAKLAAELALLICATLIATGLTLAVTRAIFPPIAVTPLLSAVALWLVQGALVVSVMTFFSVAFRARGAAAGAGLCFVLLLLLLSIWPAADRYTFVGLSAAMGMALRGASPVVAIPIVTAFGAMAAFTVAAVLVFEGKEI
ncbi:MAG: ABC transporter permease subunit [Gemmatimonadaceae bacterium]